jgi:hypothetical protein
MFTCRTCRALAIATSRQRSSMLSELADWLANWMVAIGVNCATRSAILSVVKLLRIWQRGIANAGQTRHSTGTNDSSRRAILVLGSLFVGGRINVIIHPTWIRSPMKIIESAVSVACSFHKHQLTDRIETRRLGFTPQCWSCAVSMIQSPIRNGAMRSRGFVRGKESWSFQTLPHVMCYGAGTASGCESFVCNPRKRA